LLRKISTAGQQEWVKQLLLKRDLVFLIDYWFRLVEREFWNESIKEWTLQDHFVIPGFCGCL
jgi:hypothetical protein